MQTAEEKMFPHGIPKVLGFTDFGRLLGVSQTKAAEIAKSRPDMLLRLPTEKSDRVRSELYFEIVGKKEEE